MSSALMSLITRVFRAYLTKKMPVNTLASAESPLLRAGLMEKSLALAQKVLCN